MVPVILEMSKYKSGAKKSHRKANSYGHEEISARQGNTGSGSLNSSYEMNNILGNDSFISVDRSIIHMSNDKLQELNQKHADEMLTTSRDQEYLSLLTDNEKASEDFQDFILDVFTTLEFLDSAGVSLNDLCISLSSHASKSKHLLMVNSPKILMKDIHSWIIRLGIICTFEADHTKQDVAFPS